MRAAQVKVNTLEVAVSWVHNLCGWVKKPVSGELLQLPALTWSDYTERLWHNQPGLRLFVVVLGLHLALLWKASPPLARLLPYIFMPFFCMSIMSLEPTCVGRATSFALWLHPLPRILFLARLPLVLALLVPPALGKTRSF